MHFTSLNLNNNINGNQKLKFPTSKLNLSLSLRVYYLLLAEGYERMFTSDVPTKLYAFLFSPIHTILPINPNLPDINKIMPRDEYKSWISLYAVFSSLPLIPHSQTPIYPSAPYSHTHSLHATSQTISHTYIYIQ